MTRTRWLAAKLVGVGFVSIAAAAILSYLLTWWAGPLDHINGSRFAALTFSARDITPLAYAAFAFTLGTTMGLLFRRTVPAMAVTIAVFAGVQILVPNVIRPHLLPSTTVTFPVNKITASQATGIHTRDGGSESLSSACRCRRAHGCYPLRRWRTQRTRWSPRIVTSTASQVPQAP